jgi:hypothetical protein
LMLSFVFANECEKMQFRVINITKNSLIGKKIKNLTT